MECLAANIALSIAGTVISARMIREFIPIFIQRRLYGNDKCKATPIIVPEPMGVITASVYLIIMFLFIPFPFYGWTHDEDPQFPYHNFVEFLSALISICCMIFLGFVDDILDLRWRHKLWFPTLASLPLLMVYAINFNSTSVIVPIYLQFALGSSVNIGILYYLYMGMLAVFCTNAINILAGINGLEAGQSLIIAVSVIIFNMIQLYRLEGQTWYHLFSLYLMLPYVSTTVVLFYFNWYPASVFVGDTFCYFSGMTFAVVGILGHFSKTLLLFFLPQIFNFLYSVPQLFRLVHCPRHRLPQYDSKTDKVQLSMSKFKKSELKPLGKFMLKLFGLFRLVLVREFDQDGEVWMECNNLTLICLVLRITGPISEQNLTLILLVIQVIASCLGFFVRFLMAGLIYDVVH